MKKKKRERQEGKEGKSGQQESSRRAQEAWETPSHAAVGCDEDDEAFWPCSSNSTALQFLPAQQPWPPVTSGSAVQGEVTWLGGLK